MRIFSIVIIFIIIYLCFFGVQTKAHVQPISIQQGEIFPLDISSPYSPSPVPSQNDFNVIQDKALSGDAESQLYMAYFHVNSGNIEQNFSKAAEWYKKAAEQGNARAQYYLGLMYDCGVGVPANHAEAFRWYKESVQQNDPAGHLGIAGFHFLARISHMPQYFGQYDTWRIKAIMLAKAMPSNTSLEERLWHNYYGSQPYWQNDIEIAKVLLARSKEGDGNATLYLAKMALQAQGMTFNALLVKKLVAHAASQGSHNAAFMLGAIYSGTNLIQVERNALRRLELLAHAAKSVEEPFFAVYYHFFVLSGSRPPFGDLQAAGYSLSKEQVISHQRELHNLAERGIVRAPTRYANTLAVESNNEADYLKWLEISAKGGDRYAQIKFGAFLLFEQKSEETMNKGKMLLDAGISTTDIKFLSELETSLMYPDKRRDPTIVPGVLSWFRKRYEAGDAFSALYYAIIVDRKKVPNEQATKWLLKALEGGVNQTAILLQHKEDIDVKKELKKIYAKEPLFDTLYYRVVKYERYLPNLYAIRGAQEGYGPSISLIFNVLPITGLGKETEDKWLERILNCNEWYNTDFIMDVYKYHSRHFSIELKHIREIGNGFPTYYEIHGL